MRIFGPSGTRNFPTDRSPTTIAQGGAVLTGGGVQTTLADYTVPAARRALIEWAYVAGQVTTALAAGQTASIQVNIVPAAAASEEVGFKLIPPAAAVGIERHVGPGTFSLRAGDQVLVLVVVSAGAGVVQAMGGIAGTEYDA